MSEPLLLIVGSSLGRVKPASPPTTQRIDCPEGMTGNWYQGRVCTWNVPTQSWQCTDWATTSYDCTPISATFNGPALKLTGYDIYTGPVVPGVPNGGQPRPQEDGTPPRPFGIAYYNVTVTSTSGLYTAQLYGEYWMNTFWSGTDYVVSDSSPVGYRHEIRGLDPSFNGRTATLLEGLKTGPTQVATVVNGVATFDFYMNTSDSVKKDEYEDMFVRID